MKNMSLILRRCTEDDVDIIYKMSNDSEVRMNSFNNKMISYEDHCKWYKESLLNKNRIMYIFEKDKVIIGQIRLDKKENKAIISYSIENSNRRKGYAKELLSIIKREALSEKAEILEGLVKKDNIASRKAFISNGYNESEEDAYYKYTYLLKDGNKIEIN